MTRAALLLLLCSCATTSALPMGAGSGAPPLAAAALPQPSQAVPVAAAPLPAVAPQPAPAQTAPSTTTPCVVTDRILSHGFTALPGKGGENIARIEIATPERPYLVAADLRVPVQAGKDAPTVYGGGVPLYVPRGAKNGTAPVPALVYGVLKAGEKWLLVVERRDLVNTYPFAWRVSELVQSGACK